MKLKNRFLVNYIMIFFITTFIAFIAFLVLGYASGILEGMLVKNKYNAMSLMKDNIYDIDYSNVLKNNGGLHVVNSNYTVVLSKGINNFPKSRLTATEFTQFLTQSQSVERKYSYSIAYNENENFWLIVTFPTSIRFDFNVTHNKNYKSVDENVVITFIFIVIALYLLLLTFSTVIYSRMSATSFTNPLLKLKETANKFKNGDYKIRTLISKDSEFAELEHSFNEMAQRIQSEFDLRIKSEELRRQLTLDIAHDLKNPLAVVMGYAEYLMNHPHSNHDDYLKLIYSNSSRANTLISKLFDLSKLENPQYKLNLKPVDICEYLRGKAAEYIESLEANGFLYEIDIPEQEFFVNIDEKEMNRALDNLFENAIRYNCADTKITLEVKDTDEFIVIIVKDDGIGIPVELVRDIFKPFVRADKVRNSETGGSGLGLAITQKIINLHHGDIELVSGIDKGCTFIIKLTKV